MSQLNSVILEVLKIIACRTKPTRCIHRHQEKVFNCLGKEVLERAFEGYNGCIFAYGQTEKQYITMETYLINKA
ncbi:hypothetical protein KUTeg_009200 [Tegillarca granosa]|uniref:Kinesin motor domain-containing protein n=1 Tax=Tegillarca granosa TaxID=220873 RepID=A0ABQ9F791_TEGGR|nr:hypothetical protein KUTeg_009200 [Tegillarca granosa]